MENNITSLKENEANNGFNRLFEMPVNLPKNIKIASYAFFATIVLGIINTIITNQQNDGILLSTSRMISVSIAIYSLMFTHFINLLKGKNWARILYAVLFPLFTLLTLSDTYSYLKSNNIIGLISFFQYLLQFAALILLFSRKARDWYLEQKKQQ